jgi:hypothetical protein
MHPNCLKCLTYTFRANFHAVSVALDDLEAAAPLLQKGCAVVITLKNFDGNYSKWVLARAAAEERLKFTCDRVQQLHLFRNGPVETTLVGVVR